MGLLLFSHINVPKGVKMDKNTSICKASVDYVMWFVVTKIYEWYRPFLLSISFHEFHDIPQSKTREFGILNKILN